MAVIIFENLFYDLNFYDHARQSVRVRLRRLLS